ncbi:hypothetical protein ACMFMF_009926 [Clarireedia jacksonii]
MQDNIRSGSVSYEPPSPRASYGTSPSRSISPLSGTMYSQRDTGMSNYQSPSPRRDSMQANYGVTRLQRDSMQANDGITRLQRDSMQANDGITRLQRDSMQANDGITRLQRDSMQANYGITRLQRDNPRADYEVTRLQRDNLQVPSTTSRAPPGQKSVLQSQNDAAMASRQTKYTELDTTQRKEQDDWAATIAQRTGACPHGFQWVRDDTVNGYICAPGNHVITDELVAEGKGGCYIIRDYWSGFTYLIGPWYKNDDDIWVYCGEGIPKGNINTRAKKAINGKRCGIRALGWIAGSLYKESWMRYADIAGEQRP